MEGLIPLVYRAIVEYKKAREVVAIGSFFRHGDQPCGSRASSPSPTLFCNPASSSWCAASSPAAARASLVSPLLRSASRRHCAG
ncbi:hypothetical protein HU200_016260 [Digitaria exilis]|uniref:Uncharacterized protein n=1 Tax=Digitaria exilis TaxID=1010633 RepID=A0A835KJ97_9POAL|nr:hypothetical protein HU200_016260 [Digitaria exilis]CAB3451934.1 unnamed protein product [Digitaria exilis]CAB3455689.1 unnamed protein product [Digitaria exilis]